MKVITTDGAEKDKPCELPGKGKLEQGSCLVRHKERTNRYIEAGKKEKVKSFFEESQGINA